MTQNGNKSALPPDSFDDILNKKTPNQMGMESLGLTRRTGKGAAAGCKPGHIRHTYVMPQELIDKLKAIAGYLGKPEVGVVLDILEKGVKEYENKYGPSVSDRNRGKS